MQVCRLRLSGLWKVKDAIEDSTATRPIEKRNGQSKDDQPSTTSVDAALAGAASTDVGGSTSGSGVCFLVKPCDLCG